MLSLIRPAAACLVAGLSGCLAPDAGDVPEAPPSYHRDVRPILEARCSSCHAADGIARFALSTYEDAHTYRDLIRYAVTERIMPPWPPDPDCNDYRQDRSLTAEQITTIAEWVAAGAPEGDPLDAGQPLPPIGDGLSRVDLTLSMPEAYSPKPLDDYRCFVLDWPDATQSFVTGFRVRPGATSAVHHVIAFLAGPESSRDYAERDAAEEGPGYTCFGSPGGPVEGSLGAWAPGGFGTDFPAGTGIRVRPGSKVILQVHYHVTGASPPADRTEVDFAVTDAVEREAFVAPWMNPLWLLGMHIPAGDPDVVHSYRSDPRPIFEFLFGGRLPLEQGFRVHSANLHMHELGRSATLSIERRSSTSDCLLHIPAWDFHWQSDYWLERSVVIEPGDALRIECRWDNSPENQPVDQTGRPRPPRDVTWGFGTGDEMCLGGVFITAP